MSTEEAHEFEKSELFAIILKMRTWDDKAKLVGYVVPPLEAYEDLILDHLRTHKSWALPLIKPSPTLDYDYVYDYT